MEVEYETCPGCKERKPATAFYLKRNKRPSARCMACMKVERDERARRYREKNVAQGLTTGGQPRRNAMATQSILKQPLDGGPVQISAPVALDPNCAHYFILKGVGSTSWGICLYCSGAKEFRNSMAGGEWHSAPERQLLN